MNIISIAVVLEKSNEDEGFNVCLFRLCDKENRPLSHVALSHIAKVEFLLQMCSFLSPFGNKNKNTLVPF